MIGIYEFLPQQVFGLLFILARIGSALMLMPGIGEQYINVRTRLSFAVLLSLVLLPNVTVPPVPDSPLLLFLMIAGEVGLGVLFGFSARLVLMAVETGGAIIGMQMGIANAFVLNPTMGQQAGLMSVFLSTTAIAMLFASNLHHLAIAALASSYDVFNIAGMVWEDTSGYIARLVGDTFVLAVKLAAPFLVVGLIFNVGAGLLSRLMPQIQIFFVMVPVQLAMGMLTLMLVSSFALKLFMQEYEVTIENLLAR